MSFQPGINVYSQGFGSSAENIQVPHIETRDPSPRDINYPVGKRWLNTTSQEEFILYKFQSVSGVTSAIWSSPVGATGSIISISDTTNVKTFPDTNGNIQLTGVSNQINVTSNPALNAIQLGISNPLNIAGLTAGGTVNLAAATDSVVNIGNSTSESQKINIDTGFEMNILTNSNGSELTVGNSTNSAVFNCETRFFNSVDVQGYLTSPDQGILLVNGTFSEFTSFEIISGAFNCSGAEGILQCKPIGPITITLSDGAFPGSYVTVYDSIGTAATHNITILPPTGGSILMDGQSPAANYVINTNYGNVRFYFIPDSPAINYIVFNH